MCIMYVLRSTSCNYSELDVELDVVTHAIGMKHKCDYFCLNPVNEKINIHIGIIPYQEKLNLIEKL